MESRLVVVETKLDAHAEKLKKHEDSLKSMGEQLAHTKGVQQQLLSLLQSQKEDNRIEHSALFNKLDELKSILTHKNGVMRGLTMKLVGFSAAALILAALSYYVKEVHDFFHAIMDLFVFRNNK